MKPMRRQAAGFSLLELMIVVGVLLVIAGLAIPKLMTGIANLRLRSATTDVAGQLQTARMRAIHDNQYYALRAATWNDARIYYLDLNGNGSYDLAPTAPDKPEPTVQLPTGVSIVTSSGLSLSSMSLGWTPQPQTNPPTFGEQGLPCVVTGGVCKRTDSLGNLVGYIVYVTDTRGSWAAITVSPASRIRAWYWSGSAWTN